MLAVVADRKLKEIHPACCCRALAGPVAVTKDATAAAQGADSRQAQLRRDVGDEGAARALLDIQDVAAHDIEVVPYDASEPFDADEAPEEQGVGAHNEETAQDEPRGYVDEESSPEEWATNAEDTQASPSTQEYSSQSEHVPEADAGDASVPDEWDAEEHVTQPHNEFDREETALYAQEEPSHDSAWGYGESDVLDAHDDDTDTDWGFDLQTDTLASSDSVAAQAHHDQRGEHGDEQADEDEEEVPWSRSLISGPLVLDAGLIDVSDTEYVSGGNAVVFARLVPTGELFLFSEVRTIKLYHACKWLCWHAAAKSCVRGTAALFFV
jgi:hypothetical protein